MREISPLHTVKNVFGWQSVKDTTSPDPLAIYQPTQTEFPKKLYYLSGESSGDSGELNESD